jgi:adenylate kinase
MDSIMESSRLIMLGAPGSGKGTQAAILAGEIGVPSISTGEMLRDAVADGTELGRKVEAIMSSGKLVDDQTMEAVVRQRLGQDDCRAGFILDGYPRNLGQVETLDAILAEIGIDLDAVVHISVQEAELVRRALARQREDDLEDVIRQRLEVYREQTQPLIDHYRERGLLRPVDGNQTIEAVASSVVSGLEAKA